MLGGGPTLVLCLLDPVSLLVRNQDLVMFVAAEAVGDTSASQRHWGRQGRFTSRVQVRMARGRVGLEAGGALPILLGTCPWHAVTAHPDTGFSSWCLSVSASKPA